MPKKIRIASYNVENLFRRAKLLNLADSEKIREKLNAFAELSATAEKPKYSAADKKVIEDRLKELKGYVTPNMYIGKLVNSKGKVTAKGKDDWLGTFDLVKQNFGEQTRKNTAWVIRQMNADILCVIEAEDRPALLRFGTDLLPSGSGFKRYPYCMLIDGNDTRGIDVGIYSRFPIRGLRSNIYADNGRKSVFSRDCLEVEIDAGLKRPIHFLINHFKSKGYGKPATSDARRKSQATAVAQILRSRYDLRDDYVVVAGDLNDTPDSEPLAPLTGLKNLSDVLDLSFGRDMDRRWTYAYGNQLNQIDFVMVSDPMKAGFKGAAVERRGMWAIDKYGTEGAKRYDKITRKAESASDHGGVYADFSLT